MKSGVPKKHIKYKDMKKLLFVLVSLILFSCNDDMEIAKLQEGVYDLDIRGKSYCDVNNPADYRCDQRLVIAKIDQTHYTISIGQSYYNSTREPIIKETKSILKITEGNKINGSIYVYSGMGTLIRGSIDGEIDLEGNIKGTYDGREFCYHSTAPVKATFTLIYDKYQ